MRHLAGVAVAIALAACGADTTAGQDPVPSYAGDEVVLRISREGGLLPAGSEAHVPEWTLMGDGRVFTLGPVPEIFPGPAFPNVRVSRVSRKTVARIVDAARAAGIDGVDRTYAETHVADATTTVFRLTTVSGTTETRVYALDEDPTATNDARDLLRDLRKNLTDLDGWLGEGTESKDETYEPESVAIYARVYRAERTFAPAQPPVAWHGPDPADGEGTGAGTCTVLSGDALKTVLPDLRAANAVTRWHADSTDWAFTIRPLLPDEHSCADGLR